jgi:hypothetical protein
MVAQRVVSSNYLGVGLAIVTGVAANLGLSLQAQAQVNLNIQEQLNIILPPITVQPLNGPVTPEEGKVFIQAVNKCVLVDAQSKQFAADVLNATDAFGAGVLKKDIRDVTEEDIKRAYEQYFGNSSFRALVNKKRFFASPPNTDCKIRQPVTAKVSFPFNPTYETNILKSGNNSSPGESAGFGGTMQVTAGVGNGDRGNWDRPWDLVTISGGEASTRYTPNFSPSVDGLSSQVQYQMFLDAYGYNPDTKMPVKNIDPTSPYIPPTGMITFDTLTIGYQNQTAFTPTFKAEKADLLTPQATLSRQNIGLSDQVCGAVDNKGNDGRGYCYYANFALTAGQTFSDVKTLQNVNFAASATLGWNIDPAWSVTLPAIATAKSFEDVIGGRRDLLLQVGPVLTYTGNTVPVICSPKVLKDSPFCADEGTKFTFTLPVNYYRNYSTLSTAAWSGWVIMPTLSIAFAYSPTVH